MVRSTDGMRDEDRAYLAKHGVSTPSTPEQSLDELDREELEFNEFPKWIDVAHARPPQYFFKDYPSYKSEEWSLPFKIVVLAEESKSVRVINRHKVLSFHSVVAVGNYAGIAGVGWGVGNSVAAARKSAIREAWIHMQVALPDQGTVNRPMLGHGLKRARLTVFPSMAMKGQGHFVELMRMFGLRGGTVDVLHQTKRSHGNRSEGDPYGEVLALAHAIGRSTPFFRAMEMRGMNVVHAKSPYTEHIKALHRRRGLMAAAPLASSGFKALLPEQARSPVTSHEALHANAGAASYGSIDEPGPRNTMSGTSDYHT